MKKKFLSVFVALTLVATMFSTTLAFADEEVVTDVSVIRTSDTDLWVSFGSKKEASCECFFYLDGSDLGISSDIFSVEDDGEWRFSKNITIPTTSPLMGGDQANGVRIWVGDENSEYYNKLFNIPPYDSLDFKVKRIAKNEITVEFTSEKPGSLLVMVSSLAHYWGVLPGSTQDFSSGYNKMTFRLLHEFTPEEELTNDSLETFFEFSTDENTAILEYIRVVPAFGDVEEDVVTEEPGIILPSTKDSDKFTWTGKGEASFRLDANKEDFLELYEGDKKNGKKIDKANYTVTAGSTIITLKEDYVKTLGNGTYLYTAEFKDGDAALKLVVDTDGTKSIVPKTSDANRTAGIVVLLVSLALATLSFRALRKEQTKA